MKRFIIIISVLVVLFALLLSASGIKELAHDVLAINELTLNSGSSLHIRVIDGKKTVTGFGIKRTCAELTANFINSNSVKVFYPNGKEASSATVAGTGFVLKSIGKTGTVFDSAELIVNGDVTCDGIVTVSDYTAVKRALAGSYQLNAPCLLAADADGNGLDINDDLRIKSYFKKEISLNSFSNSGLKTGETLEDQETTEPPVQTTSVPTEPDPVDDPKKTSALPKYFSTEAQFKASKVYKTYTAFASMADFGRSVVIPGAVRTNVLGTIGTSFAPQGMCFAGDYIIISAYDRNSSLNTVLYVIDKSTKAYLKTIVLSNGPHAGGLAYDGSNVWICNGTSVSAIKLSSIKTAVSKSSDSVSLSYAVTRAAGITASFMTYYNNKLWIGTFNETSTDYMYAYTIGGKTGDSPTITQVSSSASAGYRIQVPDRTQGVCFTSEGYLIVSRSYRASVDATDHIAQVRVYNMKNWTSVTSTGTIEKGDAVKVIAMAPMGEQINVNGSYVYLLFESCAYPSCAYPLDRAIAFPLSKFV